MGGTVLADLRARLIANVHAAAVEQLGPGADHGRAVRAVDALMPDIEAAFREADLYRYAEATKAEPPAALFFPIRHEAY